MTDVKRGAIVPIFEKAKLLHSQVTLGSATNLLCKNGALFESRAYDMDPRSCGQYQLFDGILVVKS